MSVGKESIRRAASTETKKEAVNTEAAPKKETAKMEAVKKETVKKETVKKEAAKKGTTKKTAPKKAAAAVKKVNASVVTPANSQEIQKKFISEKSLGKPGANRPIRITEELPVYLL